MHYSIRHLQYLSALAATKSFSKAADRCNVTQSTLSLGIKELERQMDVTLFERNRKNIIPTPAGLKALGLARIILSTSDSLGQEMARLKNPSAGPLRISVIPTIAPYFLPRALPKIEQHFPDSDVRIFEDTTETILQKVREGNTDLGILALPVATGDLQKRILFDEPFIIAAHKSTSLADGTEIGELRDHDMLLLRHGHCLKDHILQACGLSSEKQNQLFEAENLSTLLAIVNQGYGITLLPEMAVKANITAPYPNIVTRHFAPPAPNRQIGLVWRSSDLRAQDYLTIDF